MLDASVILVTAVLPVTFRSVPRVLILLTVTEMKLAETAPVEVFAISRSEPATASLVSMERGASIRLLSTKWLIYMKEEDGPNEEKYPYVERCSPLIERVRIS